MPALETTPNIRDPHSSPSREFPLPPVLRMYWVALFILSAISALAGDIYYKINLFRQCCTLADDSPLFVDFWLYNYIFHFIHTSAFFHTRDRFAYPAFSAVIYDLTYHLGPHAEAIVFTTELVVCGFAAWLFRKKICRIGLRAFPAAILVISTLIFSYPLLYLLACGNIEIFACLFTAAGLWFALKKHDKSAAVLWAAAGAMKIYPLILLALFFSRAKWRSLAVGIAAFVFVSVLSMWFVGPTIPIAFDGTVSGVGAFVSDVADTIKVEELPLDHSLLAPVKIFAYVMAHRTGSVSYLTKPYVLIVGTVALLAFFLRAVHMPLMNRLIFLFAAMVALPPVSYDYTLVHLYAPWAMLVIVALHAGAAGYSLPGFRTYFLCFAVLFTSQRFIYYHWIHPNGTFKAIALAIMIVTALRYPIPNEALYSTPAVQRVSSSNPATLFTSVG